MAKRYELTEEQYQQIKDLLPGKEGDRGRTAEDNHRFLNGVLWVLRSGAHWHDMSGRYGNWKSTHKRFTRWAKNGVWEAVFKKLLKDPNTPHGRRAGHVLDDRPNLSGKCVGSNLGEI